MNIKRYPGPQAVPSQTAASADNVDSENGRANEGEDADNPSGDISTMNGSGGGDSERPRGIYILPHLFTTAGLLAAFYAIVRAIQGEFDYAAIGILIAVIMDGLDGRIARWTNTASEFGKEYDSLVDVIAFGLTPALVAALWALKDAGKVGWLVAFLYVTATALRLARFNTQDIADKRYFHGLPCPSAAALVAAAIWCMYDYQISSTIMTTALVILTFGLATAMVSPVPYRSFKEFDPKGRVSLVTAFLVAFLFVVVTFDPPVVLFSGFLAYFLSGPVSHLTRYLMPGKSPVKLQPDATQTSSETASTAEEKKNPS